MRRTPRIASLTLVVMGTAVALVASACTSASSSTSTTGNSAPAATTTALSAPSAAFTSGANASSSTSTDPATATADSCRTEDAAVGAEGQSIKATMETEATARGLTSLLYRVTKGDELIASGAIGSNVTGVPVEQSVHFRNGNVAFAYMGTLLLLMAENGELSLQDPVSKWLPDLELPEADMVTLAMLVRNTSGYADYVTNENFVNAFEADPFRGFTQRELLDYGFATPQLYPPGTAWSYAHTNYQVLGAALQAAGKKPLGDLLNERVLIPLGLTDTAPVLTPLLPDPALHTFSAERDKLEESTFWNPSWQTARGAVLSTTICDMVRSARGVGTGEVLTPDSYTAFISDDPVEHQTPPAGCPATACRQFPGSMHYGLGVIVQSGWIFQTPLFAGQGSLHAYLPDQDLAIAIVAVTGAQSKVGANHAQDIWKILTNELSPDHAVPTS